MKAHTAIGLSKPLYLPDDIIFETKIIPSGNRNVRSNSPRNAADVKYVTRHETANFNAGADADMHYRYLMSNPSPPAGYNAVSDDRKIIHLTPYSEDTWAAGTWEGNHTSDHHELCVNSNINHSKARRIAACLDAAVIYARGLTIAQALKQHNFWTGKNCPKLLRELGLWPWYINQVQAAYNAIVAFVGGKPVPDMNLAKGDTAINTDRLNVRTGSGTSFKIVTTLDPNTEVTVIDGPRSADGYTWHDVKGSFGTGWAASDWLQKTASPVKPDPIPIPGWPYPKPLVPAFWADLTKEGATHVFADGKLWVRSNDLYRVKKNTKRLRVVGGNESVGPDLKVGDEFRDAAKGEGYDGKVYVITDGLTRVAMDDLEFIDDMDKHEAAQTLTKVLTDVLEDA